MKLLIKNAKVVDGTGNPWFWSDVLVEDKEIKLVEPKLDVRADRTIDTEGLVLAPGFVDPHDHTDGSFIFHPDMESHVTQGITTEIMGLCGTSVFPDKETFLDSQARFYGTRVMAYSKQFSTSDYDWHSLTEYAKLLMSRRPAINAVSLIGLSCILWKAGYRPVSEADVRKLTAKEIAKMKELIKQGFEEGAPGLSSTRDYTPGQYLELDDWIEPLKLAAQYNLTWFPHTKYVCTPEGLREAVELARKTGVKLHIAHVNAAPNFAHGDVNPLYECLAIIDTARAQGLDVTFDVIQWMNYCYPRGSWIYQLRHFCKVYPDKPLKGTESIEEFRKAAENPAYREEAKNTIEKYVGRAANRYEFLFKEHLDSFILIKTGDERLEGKTLGQIAKGMSTNGRNLFYDISFGVSPILANCSPDTVLIWPLTSGHPNRENVLEASNHPLGMPSLDVPTMAVPVDQYYSPSTYGTFPYFYRNAIERGVRMEEAIRKMTSYPARVLRLTDRGIIRIGMKADMVIFDPVEFRPGNNLYDPTARALGLHYVIVNGRVVLDNGKLTEERPGEFLLRGRKGV